MLHGHRQTDSERTANDLPLGSEPARAPHKSQLRATSDEIGETACRRQHGCQRSGQGCPHYPPDRYQQKIECHIQRTHHHTHHHGHLHVSAAAQHSVGKEQELVDRHGQAPHQKILRRQSRHLWRATQLDGPPRMDADAKEGDEKSQGHANRDGLSHDIACLIVLLGPDMLRHENAETSPQRSRDAAEQPTRRGHQSYACRSGCAQLSYHHGVDILHHDGAQLSEDGRQTQPPYEAEFLALGHASAVAYFLQKLLFPTHISQIGRQRYENIFIYATLRRHTILLY